MMTDSRLYILMRTDLASINAGKGMAQAAHAANAFVADMQDTTTTPDTFLAMEAFQDWQRQTTQRFGTTITLAMPTEGALTDMIAIAEALGYPAGLVHDPSYPVRDGAVTHLLPIDTCGYVFVQDASNPPPGLALLPLHP